MHRDDCICLQNSLSTISRLLATPPPEQHRSAVHDAVLATGTATESARMVAASQSNLIEKLAEIHKLLIKIKLLDNINIESRPSSSLPPTPPTPRPAEHGSVLEDGKHCQCGVRGSCPRLEEGGSHGRQPTQPPRCSHTNNSGGINQPSEGEGTGNQDRAREKKKKKKRVQFDQQHSGDDGGGGTSLRVERIDIGATRPESIVFRPAAPPRPPTTPPVSTHPTPHPTTPLTSHHIHSQVCVSLH